MTRQQLLYTTLVAFAVMTLPLRARADSPPTCLADGVEGQWIHTSDTDPVFRVRREVATVSEVLAPDTTIRAQDTPDFDGDGRHDMMLEVEHSGYSCDLIAFRTSTGYALYIIDLELGSLDVRRVPVAGRVLLLLERGGGYEFAPNDSDKGCYGGFSEDYSGRFYTIAPTVGLTFVGEVLHSHSVCVSRTGRRTETCDPVCLEFPLQYTPSADGSSIVISSADGYQLIARWDATRNVLVFGPWVRISSPRRQRRR